MDFEKNFQIWFFFLIKREWVLKRLFRYEFFIKKQNGLLKRSFKSNFFKKIKKHNEFQREITNLIF